MPRFVTFTIIPLAFSTIVVGCSNSGKLKQEQIAAAINSTGKTEVHTSESPPSFNMQATPAKWSVNTKIATDMPVLDFADDNIIIMHDYFGLFIYNLTTGEIEDSIDLQALGYDFSNDSSCKISVSPNADTIWIWSASSELLYEYDRISRNLNLTNDISEKDIFEDFVLTKDIPPEQLSVKPYRCSKKSVLFADGSYGILNVRNEKITGISYIRDDKEWVLFSDKNCTMPELSRQDDFFYEQFVNEGAESASSLIFSYCTMINYGEYAGICALSEGIEYSEELQKEWNALQLTASSEEIKTTNDKACFKVYIISSDSSPNSGLLQGINEKYIYLKKDLTNSWYVEGGVESICLVIFMVYNHWMKRERNIYNNSIPLHRMCIFSN